MKSLGLLCAIISSQAFAEMPAPPARNCLKDTNLCVGDYVIDLNNYKKKDGKPIGSMVLQFTENYKIELGNSEYNYRADQATLASIQDLAITSPDTCGSANYCVGDTVIITNTNPDLYLVTARIVGIAPLDRYVVEYKTYDIAADTYPQTKLEINLTANDFNFVSRGRY